MKVEICEFYPSESKGPLIGTLRVKLVDQGIDLLGVQVFFRDGRWFIRMPSRQGIHHETKKPVWFPLVSLSDPLLQRELISELQQQAPAFIEERFPGKLKTDLISPSQLKEKQPQQENERQTPTSAAAGKKTAPKAISGNWVDLPRKNKDTKFQKGG